jgi:hypothetical protein
LSIRICQLKKQSSTDWTWLKIWGNWFRSRNAPENDGHNPDSKTFCLNPVLHNYRMAVLRYLSCKSPCSLSTRYTRFTGLVPLTKLIMTTSVVNNTACELPCFEFNWTRSGFSYLFLWFKNYFLLSSRYDHYTSGYKLLEWCYIKTGGVLLFCLDHLTANAKPGLSRIPCHPTDVKAIIQRKII